MDAEASAEWGPIMAEDARPSRAEQALAGALILAILAGTYALGYAVDALVEITTGGLLRVELPTLVRLLSIALLAAGAWVEVSVFRVRHVEDVWASTTVTFLKLVRRRPLAERRGRAEPFVPTGPYAYVRSPMYFGILLGVLGLGVAFSSLTLFFWACILAVWYGFFLIPFEERELEALFGAGYGDYQRQVPMLVPYRKKYRPGR